MIRPASGSTKRSSSRATVDLPAPDGADDHRPPSGGEDEVEVRERRLGATRVGDGDAVQDDVPEGRKARAGRPRPALPVPRAAGVRGVEDLEDPRRGLPTRCTFVVGGGQPAERQEELGRDDQDGERGLEPDLARHQPQAELDGDQRHRDRGAPLEHEARLERGPQHGHRRVAVAQADLADPVRPAPGCARTRAASRGPRSMSAK